MHLLHLIRLAVVATIIWSAQSAILDVHLIPHSHCDTDWKLTNEEYYEQQVRAIISNVVKDLTKDTTKRFIWVETAFLKDWWLDTIVSSTLKMQLKQLIESKRLELVGGGIVMNDEACTTLNDVIDQMTDGHLFLQETFALTTDLLPTKAWQIDPFGHSSMSPAVWKAMGLDWFVGNRIPYKQKASFAQSESLQFIWRDEMTHILDHHYSTPNGFRWETKPGSSPEITAANVAARADELVTIFRNRSNSFLGDKLMVPFGDDFTFQNSSIEWDNMDQLVAYINSKPSYNVNVKYSTLSEYFNSLPSAINYPVVNTMDFFTYEDSSCHCWSGFYTSWPLLKNLARSRSALLRIADFLHAALMSLDVADESTYDDMSALRWAVDLVQHHDGITGTSPDAVRARYVQRLNDASVLVERRINDMVAKVGGFGPGISGDDSKIKAALKSGNVSAIIAMNSLAWKRDGEWVELHQLPTSFEVVDSDTRMKCQPVVLDNDVAWISLQSIPSLGFSTYVVRQLKKCPAPVVLAPTPLPTADFKISNGVVSLKFNRATGRLSAIENLVTGVKVNVKQEFMEYNAWVRENELDNVYVFRSLNGSAQPVTTAPYTLSIKQSGSAVILTQTVTSYIYQQFILLPNDDNVRIHLIIGPCPQNKEIVSRFDTDLGTDGTIYTDELGFESHERKRSQDKCLECQFYPVQSSVYLQDATKRMTIFTGYTKGAAGFADGSIDLMLVRNSIIPGKIWNNDVSTTKQHMMLRVESINHPTSRLKNVLIFENNVTVLNAPVIETSVDAWLGTPNSTYSIMEPLPQDLHLLSYKRLTNRSNDTIVIRAVNIGDSPIDACLKWTEYQFKNVTPTSMTTVRQLGSYALNTKCGLFIGKMAKLDVRTFLLVAIPVPRVPFNVTLVVLLSVGLGILAAAGVWAWIHREKIRRFRYRGEGLLITNQNDINTDL